MKKRKLFKTKLLLSFLFFPILFAILAIYFYELNTNFYKRELVDEVNEVGSKIAAHLAISLEEKISQLKLLCNHASGYALLAQLKNTKKEEIKALRAATSKILYDFQAHNHFFSELMLLNYYGDELIKFNEYAAVKEKNLKNIKNEAYFKQIIKGGERTNGIITYPNKNGVDIYLFYCTDDFSFDHPFIMIAKFKIKGLLELIDNVYQKEKILNLNNINHIPWTASIYDSSKNILLLSVPSDTNSLTINTKKTIVRNFIITKTGWNLKITMAEQDPYLPFYIYKKLFRYAFFIIFIIGIIVAIFLNRSLGSDIKILTNSILNHFQGKEKVSFSKLKSREFYQLGTMYNKLIQQLTNQAKFAAIGQTTTMVAHDVRKPISSMKALLDILPQIKDQPDKLTNFIAEVDKNISNTSIMLNDILDFSNEITLFKKKQNPQNIITSALIGVLRSKKDIKIEIEYDLKHKNYLNIDSNRIIRVLENIFSNAIEAMNGAGKICITLEDKKPLEKNDLMMVIIIKNYNSFISKQMQEKIFDPFFTYNKKNGTGLGLAICQKIVKNHEGTINVKSYEKPVKSTEFIIELPALEGNLKIKPADLIYHSDELMNFRKEKVKRIEYGDTRNTSEFLGIHKLKGRKLSLLVVDDDSLFRETIKELIYSIPQIKDHVVILESDHPNNALSLFEEQKIDYVISDIDFGEKNINGYDLTTLILEKYKETYILLNSNKRTEELDEKVRKIDSPYFLGFLPKPMKKSELLQFLACKTFESLPKDLPENISKLEEVVLIINDDITLLSSFEMIINNYAKTIAVENVKNAIYQYENNKINMIISDINLGNNEPDGFYFLEWIRQRNKEIPVYIVSGYTASEKQPKALQLGANGYYQLPINDEQLKEIILKKPIQKITDIKQIQIKDKTKQDLNKQKQIDKIIHDLNTPLAKLTMILEDMKDINEGHKKIAKKALEQIRTIIKDNNSYKKD